MSLTLDDLRGCPNLKVQSVPVPEIGEGKTAWIAELSADERDVRIDVPWGEYRERTENTTGEHFKAFAVAACLCATEARDFLAADAAAIESAAAYLGKCGNKAVSRMFDVADKLNGFSHEEREAIEKN